MTAQQNEVSPDAALLESAYQAGWVTCAAWAQRDDLCCDVGSPRYVQDRDEQFDRLRASAADTSKASEAVAYVKFEDSGTKSFSFDPAVMQKSTGFRPVFLHPAAPASEPAETPAAQVPKAERMVSESLTMTVAEIISLAHFAGIPLDPSIEVGEDERETEITIEECPKEGLHDQDGEKVIVEHFRLVAYNTEYPEEGSCGLGEALAAQAPTPASGGGEPESYERRRARIGCNCPRPSARACAGERVTYGFDCQCECHREPIAAEADTAKDDPQLGAWRCSQCGELRESWADPRWRWNGEQWEHQHEHLGHVAARKFGDPPAADRLAQTVTDAEVDAAYGYLMSVNQDVPHGILRCALETSLRARESAPQSTAPDEASQ